jgi:hypothetical protein
MEVVLPRVLTKIRIDEVSACDAGAGVGTRIILMKRHDAPTEAASRRAFFLKIFTKADAADDGANDAGDRSGENTSLADHPIVQLATLLVASGHKADLASALDHLLNTSHGAALLHRVRTHKGESPMPDNLAKIAKDIGIVRVAKAIVDGQRSYGIGESEFVGLVTEHAQKLFPDKTPDSAFAKLFSDNGPDGVLLRKAHAVVKAAPFDIQPTMVGGIGAQNEANDSEQSEASRQLGEMAEKLRAASAVPLSADQAFARVFENPKNAALAAKMHRRPSPRTSFEFPR